MRERTVAAGRAAGYSGTPLARKLGVAEDASLVLLNAPEGFDEVLAPLPGGVSVRRRLPPARRRSVDVVVLFVVRASDLGRRFTPAAESLRPDGGLWVAWPKRSSGVATDLTDNVVRELGLSKGLVDNKVCAVTDVWSGLRFVYRLADRKDL